MGVIVQIAGEHKFIVVPTYADLIANYPAVDFPRRGFVVQTTTGFRLLGTYKSRGLYYSDGIEYIFVNQILPLTQDEVNLGAEGEKYVNAVTFNGASKWNTKVDNRITILQTSVYLVTNSTRNLECSGTFSVTLPLLGTITHYEDIDITNNGTGLITVNTSGGEFLGNSSFNETSIDLYPGESLTIAKGDTTYIVK